MDCLSPKHQRFVEELFRQSMNASAAYRQAGFKGKNADVHSARLMARADIRAEVKERQKEYRMQTDFTLTKALGILAEIASCKGNRNADRVAAVREWSRLTGHSQERLKHEFPGELPQSLTDLVRRISSDPEKKSE